MNRNFWGATAWAAMLAACGQGGSLSGGAGPRSDNTDRNAACAALGDAHTVFGADALTAGYRGLEGMAATCEFESASGDRAGEIITYTAQSLGAVTLDAKMAEVVRAWDAQTETPLASMPGVGDGGQIATDLPGYQTHIAFRKGGTLVLIAARSGDSNITGEALARQMAMAVNAALAAAP